MDKQKQKLRKTSKDHQTVKNTREIVVGSILATLIAITPYLFYLHKSVPETETWDTFLFTFESHFYQNANQAFWLITQKIIPLYLLFIWFFTCRHWWYHALLVPIAMYLYQLVSFINIETEYIDLEFQLIHLIPVMAIVIPSIYLIKAKMFNKITNADKSLEELEEEFKIKPKSFFERLNDYF